MLPDSLTSVVHHPFAYGIGPLQITGFGLAMALAFISAQIVVHHELVRRGHDPAFLADMVFAAVVGGLLGGKIYYAVLTNDWGSMLSRAGLVFWGGLVGGIISCYILIRYRKLPFPRVSDVAGIGIAAAYSVGRSGCWAVGDDYGLPWNSRWAVRFPEGAPPSTAENLQRSFGVQLPAGTPLDAVIAVHPTQIYQTALAAGMFFILWRLRDHKHAEGWLFGLFCVLAGMERFIIEFFRAKDDRFFGPFTTAQVIAVVFMLVGAAWMYARRTPKPGMPGIYAGDPFDTTIAR